MKSLFCLILTLGFLCSGLTAQVRHTKELPIIADKTVDFQREVFKSTKSKSPVFVEDDEKWNTGHGDLQCNGVVFSIAPTVIEYERSAYIGGQFDSIEGIQLRGIASLVDGVFTEIGGGISGGAVYAIYDDTTNLYVAGNFTKAGNVTVNNIARWDGSAWHSLGVGTDSTVLALQMHNGMLYVGGNFVNAGGITVNYIAVWDPKTEQWHSIEAGGVSGMNGGVAVLKSNGESLYVGGGFTKAGSQSMSKLAVYRDSQWIDIGRVSGPNSFIATILHTQQLIVGGSFTRIDTTDANNIAQYDREQSAWYQLGDGFDGPVYGLSSGREGFDPLVACGDFRFMGNTEVNYVAEISQHPWGSGLNGPAYAIKANMYRYVAFQDWGNSVYVGGAFTKAGNKSSKYFAVHYEFFGSVNHEINSVGFNVFPNPVTTKAIAVQLELQRPEVISLTIQDALGREVSLLADNENVATKQYIVNVESFANGVYYCILRTEHHVTVRKMVISH